MATTRQTPLPVWKPLGNNGELLPGGKLYFYTAGTSSLKDTYTDQGGGTPAANPVILDADGAAEIWLSQTGGYKINLTDSADVQIDGWPVDNVYENQATASTTDISIDDSTASAFKVSESTNKYIDISTVGSSESIDLGNTTTTPDLQYLGEGDVTFNVKDNSSSAFLIQDSGSRDYLTVTTTNSSENITIGSSGVTPDIDMVATDVRITVKNTATAFKLRDDELIEFIAVDATDFAHVITIGNTSSNPAITLAGSGTVTFGDSMDLAFNTGTGTKIGTATTQKLSFYNATPTAQLAKADYNNWAAFGDVVDALVAIGLFDAA